MNRKCAGVFLPLPGLLLICWSWAYDSAVAAADCLPGTRPLAMEGDLSAQMVAGIDRFLDREMAHSREERKGSWAYDFSSARPFERSVETNREHLRKLVGVVDKRLPLHTLQYVADTSTPARVAETESYTASAARWEVLPGVHGEGLWLTPNKLVQARIVALPDADQTPEMLAGLAPGIEPSRQFARILAERGCEVLVPTLIYRSDTFSGNAKINRFTNQPHREWIYRQAFQMGRHVIGYELQKIFGALDFFKEESPQTKVGVIGYGEGGLLALYAAALDRRVDAALVSGYFGPRENLWHEPIYRNLFGFLNEFGDAELATLALPRTLIIEYSQEPQVSGPPAPRPGRSGAAPGRLATPAYEEVHNEVERARALAGAGPHLSSNICFFAGNDHSTTGPASEAALGAFLAALNVQPEGGGHDISQPHDLRQAFDVSARQERQVNELSAFTQQLFRDSEPAREEFFWKTLNTKDHESLRASTQPLRGYLWNDVIGQITNQALPFNARTRKTLQKPKWTAYEVVLDVFPDVFAWGYLLLPNDLKAGERRPVVVCQHGLEGLPVSVIEEHKGENFGYYKAFGARLADEGFIVFAPHNPYRGGDTFRMLQRKANPLKKSLFSFILAQHRQILDWLGRQSFVDATRIGFYGLSYGGKTAMRVPALLDGYALSICSGDFNDWNQKMISLDYPGSYMFTGEWEMYEFNLGNTFDHAEMAALIAPRPFMVERGHYDGVGIDNWVAAEYALVRRFYVQIGVPDRTEIEFFNGPHTINGVGTFAFLRNHLDWTPNR